MVQMIIVMLLSLIVMLFLTLLGGTIAFATIFLMNGNLFHGGVFLFLAIVLLIVALVVALEFALQHEERK